MEGTAARAQLDNMDNLEEAVGATREELEDLIEELVGEIFSEHAQQVPELIKREVNGSFLVLGNVPIRDVNRELGLELPEEGEWTTVAGLCLALAGKVPAAGEKVTTSNGVTVEVLDASPRRIRSVRLVPAPPVHRG
jgi:putative hemolysin